jgi:DNA replication protein DnaC
MDGPRDQWHSLGEGLRRATDEKAEPVQGPLIELARLPPSTELRSTLTRHEATPRPVSGPSLTEWLREQGFHARRVAWGEQRDAIQAKRPEGCWCLGLGGRDERRINLESDTLAFDTYCPCPDGVAAEAAARALYREIAQDRERRQLERVFAHAAYSRLEQFEHCLLGTYAPTVAAVGGREAGEYAGRIVRSLERWLQQLLAGESRRRSLFLYGPFGTGKTGLAYALLRAYIELTGNTPLFTTVPDLLDRIRASYGDHPSVDEAEVLRLVKTVPFCVLDDIGAERVTDWVQERLFVIINARHDGNLPTIFTSNLALSALADHLGDRTTWRIVEMCQVVRLTGPNLRTADEGAADDLPQG